MADSLYYIVQSDGTRVPRHFSGDLEGTENKDASATLAIEDSGSTIFVDTDAIVFTLPAVVTGVTYTFINVGADGNNDITLSPDAANGIIGTIANAAADSVAGGVADKDIVNTKATSNKGDRITIIGATSNWLITGGVGIWASEA